MEKFFKNKKVLITGHTGFKGSWLTQILLNFKADVIGISLPPETTPNLFTVLKQKNKIKNYFVDIRNLNKIKNIIIKEKPEIVFHLAAQALVRDSYDDPIKTYSTNTIGTINVLEAIRKTSSVKSVVVITTDKVYENNELGISFKETDSLNGHDPYSSSKAAADIATQSYIKSFFNKKQGPQVAIARAGNVIGGGDWSKDRLIPDIMYSIYEKNAQVEIRNPQAIRPWQHVLEPLFGYLTLSKGLYQKKQNFIGAWNFGPKNESFVPVGNLTKEVFKIIGKGKLKIRSEKSKHEAEILKLNITKAKNTLKWYPILNFHKNIKLTSEWYKNYYEKTIDPIKFTNNQIKRFLDLL